MMQLSLPPTRFSPSPQAVAVSQSAEKPAASPSFSGVDSFEKVEAFGAKSRSGFPFEFNKQAILQHFTERVGQEISPIFLPRNTRLKKPEYPTAEAINPGGVALFLKNMYREMGEAIITQDKYALLLPYTRLWVEHDIADYNIILKGGYKLTEGGFNCVEALTDNQTAREYNYMTSSTITNEIDERFLKFLTDANYGLGINPNTVRRVSS